MKRIHGWLWAVALSVNAGCNGEQTTPELASSAGAGEGGSEAGAGGIGATSLTVGEGGVPGLDWQHAEGGAENLDEQLMESCIRMCTAWEALDAHSPCEPGQYMKHAVLFEREPEAGTSEIPELELNPACPLWCEKSFEEFPATCVVAEIEFAYCIGEAEFFCGVTGGWGFNDCYGVDDPAKYCPP